MGGVKSKPSFLVYAHDPMCSLGCVDGVYDVLTNSGLYTVKIVGPDSYPQEPLNKEALVKTDCLVIGGGLGDSDQFYTKMNSVSSDIIDYVANGGNYLGICMGSYFAGRHYLNILSEDTDAVQYVKRKGSTIKEEHQDVVNLNWNKEERTVFFYDGAAFVPRNKKENKISGKIIATYKNGDCAALIQKYKKGKVGVIGPHPEAHKWWFYSFKRIKNRWKDCIQHDLLLDFVKKLL